MTEPRTVAALDALLRDRPQPPRPRSARNRGAVTVGVTGGHLTRSDRDRDHAWATLDAMHEATPISLLVHGDAAGFDSFARWWAEDRGVPHEPHPAIWRPGGIYDNAAGHKRNRRMAERLKRALPAAMLVAFPGRNGTAGMIGVSLRLGVPCRQCCELHPFAVAR